jgi:hypothetical protein
VVVFTREHLVPVQEQKNLALALIRLDTTEDKLAGILFWQEVLLPAGEVDWPTDLPAFAQSAGWGNCKVSRSQTVAVVLTQLGLCG